MSDTYILDANILARLADTNHHHHDIVKNAVKKMRRQGASLRTIPQSFFEFWVVVTRPLASNGWGLTIEEAETFLDYFSRSYWIMPDDPALLTCWRRLIVRYSISGRQAHDARYIAAMQAHNLTHFLTFDKDFERYKKENIVIVNPAQIV